MAHRTYRLSISPERAPEVRRVIDFDGRCSLQDVHEMIQQTLELDSDHLYAFYLSGRYFDVQTEYGDGSGSRPAHTALLFRLGLRPGKSFAYLFDFGDELRHSVTVLSVGDVAVPLKEPMLVESVGEAPPQYFGGDESEAVGLDEPPDSDQGHAEALPPELVVLAPLAERVIALHEKLELLEGPESSREPEAGNSEPEAATSEPDASTSQSQAAALRELAQAALELAQALEGDIQRFVALEDWLCHSEWAALLFELPTQLSLAGETEQALAIARAFTFLAPDEFRGELALALARAGRHEEAKAQVALNLESVEIAAIAEGKAGDVYLALGESASAEAYYRRALVEATTPSDRRLAAVRLSSFLLDSGRESEAQALLEQQTRGSRAPAVPRKASSPAVGRNEPCPCGSGKKYKKCHGANA